MLFKTNTNGHKHPSISLVIIEQDAIVETEENNKWHSTEEPHTPQKQSYRLWWGAASPILNDTPCVCIYTSYNHNSYKECIRIDKYILTQSSWTRKRSSGRQTSSNPQVSALIPRPFIDRMERVCQRHGINQTPILLFEPKTHKVNQFIKCNICSRGGFAINIFVGKIWFGALHFSTLSIEKKLVQQHPSLHYVSQSPNLLEATLA